MKLEIKGFNFDNIVIIMLQLTVVIVSNSDPSDALGLVVTCHIRYTTPFSGQQVLDLVHFVVFVVDSTAETGNVNI